jgi:spore coat protein CotH
MIDRLRWKRHRKLVVGLTLGLVVLVGGFGNARVSAITSSERHETTAFISTDIKGRGALFDDGTTHTIALTFTQADYERLIAAYQTEGRKPTSRPASRSTARRSARSACA